MARRRSSGITSLRFNQDQGCFTCCLTSGLRVYNVDPLVEKTHYSQEEVGEVLLCEMIHRSNWLLVVRSQKPCSLMILDDQQRKFRAEVTFKSPVRALRARRDKVAVVLNTSVHVLSIPGLQRIALLRTGPSACAGAGSRPLCALATQHNAPHQMLAAPALRRGALQLLDLSRSAKGSTSTTPSTLTCHKGSLVCISLSASGSRLATASDRGTLIRLWDTTTKNLLHELRRGSDYADVYCIALNPVGSVVSCVSDKGTVHVWGAGGGGGGGASGGGGGGASHSAAASAVPGTPAQIAFLTDNNTVVICEDGTFHKFTYSEGGACHRSDFEYFLQVGDDDDFVQ